MGVSCSLKRDIEDESLSYAYSGRKGKTETGQGGPREEARRG